MHGFNEGHLSRTAVSVSLLSGRNSVHRHVILVPRTNVWNMIWSAGRVVPSRPDISNITLDWKFYWCGMESVSLESIPQYFTHLWFCYYMYANEHNLYKNAWTTDLLHRSHNAPIPCAHVGTFLLHKMVHWRIFVSCSLVGLGGWVY